MNGIERKGKGGEGRRGEGGEERGGVWIILVGGSLCLSAALQCFLSASACIDVLRAKAL